MTPQYSYSTDEENYHGEYSSREQAAMAGFHENEDYDFIYVGENALPVPPEDIIEASDLIEKVQCHEDYETEWADGWPRVATHQVEELTSEIRKVFAAWLDKYAARPAFWTVEKVMRHERP